MIKNSWAKNNFSWNCVPHFILAQLEVSKQVLYLLTFSML